MKFQNESIFRSSFRRFCNSFATLLGIFLCLVVIFIGLSFFSTPIITPDTLDVMIAPDQKGKRELLSDSAPVILRMNFHGVIGDGDLISETIDNLLVDSREGLFKQGRVKAILLHMSTPGGTVTDADDIYRALLSYKEAYKVPVYAFVDGLCASGGVYISAAADKIYASPSSVIGSVGVILGPTFNVSGAMDKYGIQSLTLTQGKDKDMLNPFRPWKEGEDQSLRTITEKLYSRFVEVVLAARPMMDKEKLINQYGAQVFVASEAQKLGYIDEGDSSYKVALSDLAIAAGLKEDEYQVFELKPRHPFLSELTQSKLSLLKGELTHVVQIGPQLNKDLSGKFLYLYQPH